MTSSLRLKWRLHIQGFNQLNLDSGGCRTTLSRRVQIQNTNVDVTHCASNLVERLDTVMISLQTIILYYGARLIRNDHMQYLDDMTGVK